MIQVHAFTEAIADTAVRYQLTVMEGSVMVWVQQVDRDKGNGSMPHLAVAMPSAVGHDGLPAATGIVGCRENSASERFASRIAKRSGMVIYACIDLGDTEDVATDVVFGRIIEELNRIKHTKQ